MQELIKHLDYSIENSKDDYKINFQWIKFHAEILLEKEKEQIMMAFNDGKINSVLKKRDYKDYYNQTYNQNK